MEKHEKLLDGYIDNYVAKLKTLRGDWVDLSEWMHIFALDALATVTFSKSNGYTSAGNDGGNMVGSDKHWAYFTVVGLFPWLVDLTQRIPHVGMFLMIPIALGFGIPIPTGLPIFKFAVPNVLDRLSRLQSTKEIKPPADRPGIVTSDMDPNATSKEETGDQGQKQDLLADLMTLHTKKEEKFLPAWVLGIALTNFGAGHDTMTITLTGSIYQLASNPAVQERLVKELRDAGIGPDARYTDIVNKVPYLMACLKESMRLFPAIGTQIPRIVPSTGTTLANTYLPPGTTVGVNLWALHHDPSIFPDPEKFLPERWLSDGTEETKQKIGRLDANWMGFGGGSRSCPGQYLARFFVVKILAALLLNFEVVIKGEPKFKGWFSCHVYGVDVMFKRRT